jgi:hypothetical protein
MYASGIYQRSLSDRHDPGDHGRGPIVHAVLPEIHLDPHRSKLITHLLLALALLLAQAGAQAHAYSHLSTGTAKSDLSAAGQLCRDCLSFAPVASPGGSPQVLEFAVTINSSEHLLCLEALPTRPSVHSHYRSRAPPTLL